MRPARSFLAGEHLSLCSLSVARMLRDSGTIALRSQDLNPLLQPQSIAVCAAQLQSTPRLLCCSRISWLLAIAAPVLLDLRAVSACSRVSLKESHNLPYREWIGECLLEQRDPSPSNTCTTFPRLLAFFLTKVFFVHKFLEAESCLVTFAHIAQRMPDRWSEQTVEQHGALAYAECRTWPYTRISTSKSNTYRNIRERSRLCNRYEKPSRFQKAVQWKQPCCERTAIPVIGAGVGVQRQAAFRTSTTWSTLSA